MNRNRIKIYNYETLQGTTGNWTFDEIYNFETRWSKSSWNVLKDKFVNIKLR